MPEQPLDNPAFEQDQAAQLESGRVRRLQQQRLTEEEDVRNRTAKANRSLGAAAKTAKAGGAAAQVAGRGVQAAGKGVDIAGKGIGLAGKGVSAAGSGIMSAGSALSSTGLGAIVGVPLAAIGGATKVAGAGLQAGGKGVSAAGKGVSAAGKGTARAGKRARLAGGKLNQLRSKGLNPSNRASRRLTKTTGSAVTAKVGGGKGPAAGRGPAAKIQAAKNIANAGKTKDDFIKLGKMLRWRGIFAAMGTTFWWLALPLIPWNAHKLYCDKELEVLAKKAANTPLGPLDAVPWIRIAKILGRNAGLVLAAEWMLCASLTILGFGLVLLIFVMISVIKQCTADPIMMAKCMGII